jgi:hypothetical protein
MCGVTTTTGYVLTFNQLECVSFSNIAHHTIEIPLDNTEVTIATAGGTGELALYVNENGWASRRDYQYSSENTGTSQSITFTAKAGKVYIALDANYTDIKEVSLLVSTDTSLLTPDPVTGGDTGDGYPTDATRFIGLNGQALVERIALSSPKNVAPIYTISGSDATQIYAEANMIAIANAITNRAPAYVDEDTTGIESLLAFFRGAYYIKFSYPDDIPSYSDKVNQAITSALRAYFANDNVWLASEANGSILKEALTTVDSAGLGADFNDITIKVLNEYNEQWQASQAMTDATNTVFTTIYRAKWDEPLKALYATDDKILTALNNFQSSQRYLLGTNAELLVINSARELSRLYHIPEMKDKVKVLVKGILDSTSKNDETKALWLTTAAMADFYDRNSCDYYGICGFAFNLERETLAFNYKCSNTLKIRAQGLYNRQAQWMCDVLGTQESNFHQMLNTLNIPVDQDKNDDLELVIFNSPKDYKTYAGIFFPMDTNNGGMYLEGKPNADKNQARFIAYEADWLQPNFHVWNLQHEYVHYLDGRFNLFGDFTRNLSANTIWWLEGLAEYISYRDAYTAAIEAGKTQQYPLSEIFKNNYQSGTERIYRWGYLAVRFMFEKHPGDVSQLVSYLRTNQYDQYQTYLNNIGARYDNEWNTWLVSDLSTTDNGIVQYGPNDTDASYSGTAGNWAGDPVTISTDFSPCKPDDIANLHNPESKTVALNSVIECVDAKKGRVLFSFSNRDNESGSITLTTSGGWGNADIMYNTQTWANSDNYESKATANGNYDSIVVQLNPDKAWHYITLEGDFGGVRLSITKN